MRLCLTGWILFAALRFSSALCAAGNANTDSVLYIIHVHSSADASVKIQMLGEQGRKTGLSKLSRISGSSHRPNTPTTIRVHMADIGKIVELEVVREAGSGGWCVDKVQVDIPCRHERYTFPFDTCLHGRSAASPVAGTKLQNELERVQGRFARGVNDTQNGTRAAGVAASASNRSSTPGEVAGASEAVDNYLGPLQVWAWIVIGVSGGLCLCCSVFCFFMYKRRKHHKKKHHHHHADEKHDDHDHPDNVVTSDFFHQQSGSQLTSQPVTDKSESELDSAYDTKKDKKGGHKHDKHAAGSKKQEAADDGMHSAIDHEIEVSKSAKH